MYPDTQIYKSLFDHAKEGLVLTDLRGIIELVNPRFLDVFGYDSESEVLGQPIEIVIPQHIRQKHIAHRHKYYRDPKNVSLGNERYLQGQKKDGSLIFIEVSLSHFNNDEGELKVLAFVVDINDKVITQKELDRERELNDLKSRFVSMASHEFRTPLSSIHSSATLVGKYQRTDQQPNRDKHLKRIKQSVKNLVAILDDVLILEKIEEDKIEFKVERVEISGLLNEICDEMQNLADEGKNIEYHHLGDSVFHTDQKMIYNIAYNLISNAIKYSMPNGKIIVNGEVGANVFILKVKDHGIGIPLDEQNQLFERFFRAKNVTNIKGTGLGLSIVKRYVDILGGIINFNSTVNVSTTFIIKLPNMISDIQI